MDQDAPSSPDRNKAPEQQPVRQDFDELSRVTQSHASGLGKFWAELKRRKVVRVVMVYTFAGCLSLGNLSSLLQAQNFNLGPSKKSDLLKAVEAGSVKTVTALLELGADANAVRRSSKYTPLYVACDKGNSAIAEALIAHGALVNQRSAGGATALQIAAYRGHLRVATLLLDSGADLKAYGLLNRQAIHSAAQNGSLNVVRLLVEKGADIMVEDGDMGVTPLYLAAGNGHTKVVEYLHELGADLNVRSWDGGLAVQAAALNGHLETVKKLIALGADIHSPGFMNRLPVHSAAQAGQVEIVKLFLENGVNVNALGQDGESAVYLAAERGEAETVGLLLQHGAEPGLVTKSKSETALHVAALIGDLETVRLLLEAGVSVSATTRRKHIALHEAVVTRFPSAHPYAKTFPFRSEEEKLEVVKLLIDYGSDTSAFTLEGLSPFRMAMRYGTTQIADAIQNHKPREIKKISRKQ